MNTTEQLAALNTFRAAEGLEPLKSWKAARNAPQLAAYVTAADAKATADALAAANTAKVKPAPKAKEPKPQTKKSRVLDLLTAKGGTTIAQIASTLAIGDTAARSLIGDLRRDGAKVTAIKGKDGIVVYTA